MNKVRIIGWRYGLDKIGMTKTIRKHLGFSLAKGKHCTDQVLDGIEVILDVADAGTARALSLELDALGAEVVLESEVHSAQGV